MTVNGSPHFLIVGAPKSGTTSLYKYLSQHPMVFMPEKKEPVFFCEYERAFQGPGSREFDANLVTDAKAYLSLFTGAPTGSLTGEASTDYLSCPGAPIRIKQWNPAAKIIICLRNPIERAYSEHVHLVRDTLEQEDFKTALMLEEKRRADRWIPLFWHVERSMYHDAVKRYLETFGEQNVKVVLYEDLVRDPATVIATLFRFLNLPLANVDVTRPHNVSGYPRSSALQAFLLREGHVKTLMKKLVNKEIRTSIKEAAFLANLQKRDLKAKDHRFLREKLVEDIISLQHLLHTNLENWVSEQR
jgi:hypothetical protein